MWAWVFGNDRIPKPLPILLILGLLEFVPTAEFMAFIHRPGRPPVWTEANPDLLRSAPARPHFLRARGPGEVGLVGSDALLALTLHAGTCQT